MKNNKTTKKLLSIIVFSLFFVSIPSTAPAKEASVNAIQNKIQFERQENIANRKQLLLKKKEAAQKELKQKQERLKEQRALKKEGIKDSVKARRGVIKTNIKERRGKFKIMKAEKFKKYKNKIEAIKQKTRKRRESFRSKIQKRREGVKIKIKERRNNLKERLSKIKNERKKKIVERIADKINSLNERRTTHYSRVIERLEKVLEKITTRANKAKENGQDISSVLTAITTAEEALSAGRNAVEVQTGGVYEILINDENTLRADVSKARKALSGDLKSVHIIIKNAYKSVREVAVTLAKIPKINEYNVIEEGTDKETEATSKASDDKTINANNNAE